MWEFLGAIGGAMIGAAITWRLESNRTKSIIEETIKGADREVYREVEKLNRNLKKEIADENKLFQEKWEQKKIDANLKAKARLEWIGEVRQLVAEFITHAIHYISIIKELDALDEIKNNIIIDYKSDMSHKNEKYNDLEREVEGQKKLKNNQSMWEAQRNRLDLHYYKANEILYKLELYISKQVDHEEMITLIDWFIENQNKLTIHVDRYHSKSFSEFNNVSNSCTDYLDKVDRFKDIFRDYLKEEWDRAKNGE